jgi:DNA-binding NtrC family response regulator
MMRCLVAQFENQRIRFPLPETQAIIGSSAASDIVLPFPGVSRAHARLVCSADRIQLLDLGSKNRLLVGAERRDEADLVEGTPVQVGRVFLTIENVSSSDVQLAIRVPSGAMQDRSSAADTHDGSGEHAPGAALRFVRMVESTRGRDFQRRCNELLELAREILGATSIAGFAIDSGGTVAIDMVSGSLPAESWLDELRFLAHDRADRAMPIFRRGSTERFLCWIDRRKTGAAALLIAFPGPDPAIEAWKVDLGGYVALKFGAVSLPPVAALERLTPLKLPAEMVDTTSAAMRKLLDHLAATVSSRLDVLLWGETGTGKELFAKMIHDSGPTVSGPFVAINCAAIPSELLEAELFGVEGRVATGVDPRKGYFLLADGGSIFLDEVGELPERLQAKLLRVLQEREVLPLGASRPRRISLRVIAASNRDLQALTQDGRFRADLYYRLRGLQFHIPPLRDRREDIPALVMAFVHRACVEYERRVTGVSRRALSLLMEYDWPGNVRELKSEVERAVLVTPNGSAIPAEAFAAVQWSLAHRRPERPPSSATAFATPEDSPRGVSLQGQLDDVERQEILRALDQSRGNRSRAARILGISRNGLTLKLRRLGISG